MNANEFQKHLENDIIPFWNRIESKCRDNEGYFDAFSRDFSPASNEKLSENGVMAERTMNTLLHVMEAYTELYKADEFYAVGEQYNSTAQLQKMYASEYALTL